MFLDWFSYLDRFITHNLWLNCEKCNEVVPSRMMVLFSHDGDLLSVYIELVCIHIHMYLSMRWQGGGLIIHEKLGTLGS